MEALIGKIVKNDIVNKLGLVLVSARTILDHDHIKLLQQHDIDAADITIMEAVSNPEPTAYSAIVNTAAARCKELFHQIHMTKKVPLLEIKTEILPMLQQAAGNPDIFHLFESVRAKDEYTHQHNIGVGVLSTLIGKWLHLPETDLALLSLAAVLHDVGKVRIPEHILLKPGSLTKEEYDEMKRHTVYGYEILKDTVGLNPRVSVVALQHHEREDGRGYPLHMKGNLLDPMSKIVSVADIFHAMTSNRPYREPLSFHEVASQMRHGSFGELDPHIVSTFLANMIRKMIGRRILLTNGKYGEVVYINPHDDLHPIVKVGPVFLDLSVGRNVHIQDIFV